MISQKSFFAVHHRERTESRERQKAMDEGSFEYDEGPLEHSSETTPSGMRLWLESFGLNADLVYLIAFLSVIVVFFLYRVRTVSSVKEIKE